MKQKIFSGIKAAFGQVGLEVRRKKSSIWEPDPITAITYSPSLLTNTQLPIEKGRNPLNLSHQNDSLSQSLAEANLKRGGITEHNLREALRAYYRSHTQEHETLAQKLEKQLGIRLSKSNCLHTTPTWARMYPWQFDDYSTSLTMQKLNLAFENNQAARTSIPEPLDSRSTEKIEVEAHRLYKIYQSILRNGYDTTAYDQISAHILIDGANWCWWIKGGFHRTAVLQHLGYSKIPAKINGIIIRQHYQHWNGVKNRIFSPIEALAYFDSVMNS